MINSYAACDLTSALLCNPLIHQFSHFLFLLFKSFRIFCIAIRCLSIHAISNSFAIHSNSIAIRLHALAVPSPCAMGRICSYLTFSMIFCMRIHLKLSANLFIANSVEIHCELIADSCCRIQEQFRSNSLRVLCISTTNLMQFHIISFAN